MSLWFVTATMKTLPHLAAVQLGSHEHLVQAKLRAGAWKASWRQASCLRVLFGATTSLYSKFLHPVYNDNPRELCDVTKQFFLRGYRGRGLKVWDSGGRR